jgi:hypothetical protein
VPYWEEATRAPSAVGKKESAAVASAHFSYGLGSARAIMINFVHFIESYENAQ